MPHSEAEKFLPMTNLQQYYMEEFLAQCCEEQPLVGLRWGSAVVDLVRQPEEVIALVDTLEGPYRLRCSYLIATDGARSQVRKLLALEFAGSLPTATRWQPAAYANLRSQILDAPRERL